MLLSANSCFTVLLLGINLLSICVFTFQNDLKQIEYEDSLCIFRAYFGYSVCAMMNYSFLLQALNRYILVIYPHRLFWQSIRSQILLICITWLFSSVYPLEFLLSGEIIYNRNNQICQIPFQLSFSINYMGFCIYVIPVLTTMFIYFKLVRYVKQMNKRVIPANILLRAHRELKMVRRTVILIIILITVCLPYQILIIISFFTYPPKYHFRIVYIIINISLVCIIIVLFQFTDQLKTSIMKRIGRPPNAVLPGVP
ncbi:unnamed protein product [Adineta steineri]|uniref:G-protein coupled receptors family 1 profile domain-containing protein n=1 Tax=Adineta steineri TaxID=433720 RepID=A0A814YBC6_9BILA|nr:unnamed protein product [Adineta steineri]CAF3918054.1 unnamed protein product [Adineta steineri]